MEDIIKIVKSLEKLVFMIKGVCKAIETEAKEQNGGFLGILFGTLIIQQLLDNWGIC